MSKRLHPTLADYLVVAVSPALIMALVGSLVFFLIDLFYQGQYVERLHFVFALFVMASVLVGRIAIEMGSSHAMMYAAPLAVVAFLALQRFVQYPGGAAAVNPIVNAALVGLILWCSQKLTWDCTFIDESLEESGEGVLRTMGLDPPKANSPTSPLASSQAQKDAAASAQPRPHSGGVWVVYFSLAALPVFGIGQRFLPPQDLDRRRYAFLLLCVYVASALGLLLTTSFLGLRRYLRRRRLQMPAAMAGVWVATGCLLIAATLGVALLLPRPNPEYALSEVPWKWSSENRSASRHALGKEGTRDSRQDTPAGEDHGPEKASKAAGQPTEGPTDARRQDHERPGEGKTPASRLAPKTSDDETRKGQGGQKESPGTDTSRDSPQSSQSREGSRPDAHRGQGKPKGSGQPQSEPQSQSQPQGRGTHQNQGAQGQSKESLSGDRKVGQDEQVRSAAGGKVDREPDAETQRAGKADDAAQRDASPPSTPPSSPQAPSDPFAWGFSLVEIVKWIFYLAVLVAVAYAGWRSRAAVAQALRELAEAWRAFWARLFGPKGGSRRTTSDPTAGETKAVPRPFAAYADPFAAGWVERWSPEELVRYSFAALEAWAREHGCPRAPEQTPREFVDRIGAQSPRLKDSCLRMAELYCRVAYASGEVPAGGMVALREFWQQLTST
jgi:hypothetical protein